MQEGGVVMKRGAAALAIAVMVLGGCAGHTSKAQRILSAYRAGDMQTALIEAQERVDGSVDSQNELIWLLEAGSVARAAGDYEKSNEYFDRADELLTDFESKPQVSISAESLAMVSNQSELPYRGRTYDGVMLNTYKALNYLAMGDTNGARVELNRAYERQRLAVENNAKRIEAAEAKAKEEGVDIAKAQQDDRFRQQFAEHFGEYEDPDTVGQYAPYANYVNPLTEFVQSLYFMAAAYDASDLERAAKSMQRVAGMAQDNPYVVEDLALAEKAANGSPLPPVTYVVFETGVAPHRDTIRIDLPIFLLGRHSGGVDYVGAAFPVLKTDDAYRGDIEVVTADGPAHPQMLCSMDRVIKQDFKNELPLVITKTLISTTVKAAAAYGMNEATKSDQMVNLFTRIGTTTYQAAMNQADERTWLTLPKQFRYARFPTPADGTATVYDAADGAEHVVELDPGKVNVVWIKSVSPTTPLLVSSFALP